MSAVRNINTDIMELVNDDQCTDVAVVKQSVWDAASDTQRTKAEAKAKVIEVLFSSVQQERFRSMSKAIESYLLEVKLNGAAMHPLAFELGNKGKPVTRATLHNWAKKFKDGGVEALIESRGGSKRVTYGWESRALNIWQAPQNRAATVVAAMLRKEGHESARDDRVRNYLNALPADVLARGRAGVKLFTNTQRAYKRINTDHLAPGDVYQGDGNTLDIYMQHPTGKRVWRAELTVWLDVASRKLVGWYLSSAESGNSTLFALSHAMMSQNHVPAILHIDNGSGFKNKMMNDLETGFYQKFGIEVMKARPYNAKGKGRVERFFQTMQEQFLKRFDSYCGKDCDPEHKKKLVKLHAKGEANLPTSEDFSALFQDWLDTEYHQNSHKGLMGKSPNEVYEAQRRHEPLNAANEAIFWPRTALTVNRETIKLKGDEYAAAGLGAYNGRKVIVEYSPHSTEMVRVLTTKGQWILDANLINSHQYVSTDRLELARRKTKLAAIKRKQADIREIELRERLAVTHDQLLDDPVLNAAKPSKVIESHADERNPLNDLNQQPSIETINLKDLF